MGGTGPARGRGYCRYGDETIIMISIEHWSIGIVVMLIS